MPFCHHCGVCTDEQARFCVRCGIRLDATDPDDPPRKAIIGKPVSHRARGKAAPGPSDRGSESHARSRRLDDGDRPARQTGGRHLAVTALTPRQLLRAATIAGVALTIVLVVLSVLVSLAATSLGVGGAPLQRLRTAALLLLLALGTPVEIVSSPARAGVIAPPLLVTLFLLSTVAILTRHGAGRSRPPATRLPECLVTGGIVGLLAALVAVSTAEPVRLDRMEEFALVGASPGWALLGGLVVGTLGAVMGHASWFARRDLAPASWTRPLRTTGDILRATALAGLGLLVPVALQVGTVEPWMIAAALAYLPNIVIGSSGLALGGTLSASARTNAADDAWSQVLGNAVPLGTTGLFTGAWPTPLVLLVVVLMLTLTVVIGVRATLRDAPGAPALARAWPPLVMVMLAWTVMLATARVRVDFAATPGDLAGTAHATGGLSAPSTLLMAAFWTTLALAAGPAVTRALGAAAPIQIGRLAGAHLDPAWRLVLVDAALRKGSPVPGRWSNIEADLREGRCTPPTDALKAPVRHGGPWLFVGAGVVAGLLALVAAYLMLTWLAYSPSASVSRYLDAVADQDSERVHRILDTSEATRVPFGDLSEYTVERDDGSGATRAVLATFHTQDGELTRAFHVEREGREFGVFDRWVLKDPYSTVTLTAGPGVDPSSLTLDGTRVGQGTHNAYPGIHTVGGTSLPWYAAPQGHLVPALGESAVVEVTTTLADGSTETAEAAVRAYVDQCAATGVASPPGCPFMRWAWFGPVATTWTIDDYPTISVEPGPDGSLAVSSTQQGTASWTAGDLSGAESFGVSGTVARDGPASSAALFTPY